MIVLFSYFCSKNIVPTIYVLSKNKKNNIIFHLKISHRHVIVMANKTQLNILGFEGEVGPVKLVLAPQLFITDRYKAVVLL